MAITRRAFLAASAATGSFSLLGTGPSLESDLLSLGLTGLARACDRPGWFQAHWGAAVLATHYLLKENEIEEPLRQAILSQAKALIAKYPTTFEPLKPEGPDPTLLGKLPRALEGSISGLRASGHAVIFAALALRALQDEPRRITPAVVNGLVRLSERIGKKRPLADHDYNRDNPLPSYTDEASLADATFSCILRYEGVRFAPAGGDGLRRPNFTHQLTYTDALLQLKRMGYGVLAKRGHGAHRVYLNDAPPKDAARGARPHPAATLENLLSHGYWEERPRQLGWERAFDARENRMGHWVVGHLFKILYSYVRVRKLVKDPGKVRRVDRIVLQRYVDPSTSGG